MPWKKYVFLVLNLFTQPIFFIFSDFMSCLGKIRILASTKESLEEITTVIFIA